MIRIIVTLGMLCCFLHATSVDARRHSSLNERVASPVGPTPVSNPCNLRDTFFALHETVSRLADEADDLGDTALNLRHRSSTRLYRRIEDGWDDVRHQAEPALDTLAYMPISLDSVSPNDARKVAAMALAAAYRNALDRSVDYTHYALLYERSESSVAMNAHPLFQTLNFGVTRSSVRGDDDTYVRGMLDANVMEVKNALRATLFPEFRYAKLCRPALPARRQAASRKVRSSVS